VIPTPRRSSTTRYVGSPSLPAANPQQALQPSSTPRRSGGRDESASRMTVWSCARAGLEQGGVQRDVTAARRLFPVPGGIFIAAAIEARRCCPAALAPAAFVTRRSASTTQAPLPPPSLSYCRRFEARRCCPAALAPAAFATRRSASTTHLCYRLLHLQPPPPLTGVAVWLWEQALAEKIENLEPYKGLSRPTFLFYRVRRCSPPRCLAERAPFVVRWVRVDETRVVHQTCGRLWDSHTVWKTGGGAAGKHSSTRLRRVRDGVGMTERQAGRDGGGT
jgi:hypothetical protein